MKKAELFVIVLLVAGMFFLNIAVHELTHVALSTRPAGVCFGYCPLKEGIFSYGATYYHAGGTVWRDEFLPNLFGYGSFFFLLWLYISLQYKEAVEHVRKKRNETRAKD